MTLVRRVPVAIANRVVRTADVDAAVQQRGRTHEQRRDLFSFQDIRRLVFVAAVPAKEEKTIAILVTRQLHGYENLIVGEGDTFRPGRM